MKHCAIYYSTPWCSRWMRNTACLPGLKLRVWSRLRERFKMLFVEADSLMNDALWGLSGSEVGRVHKTWLCMKQLEFCLLIIFRSRLPQEDSSVRRAGEEIFQSQLWQIISNWHLRSHCLSSQVITVPRLRNVNLINAQWKLADIILLLTTDYLILKSVTAVQPIFQTDKGEKMVLYRSCQSNLFLKTTVVITQQK